MGFKHRTHVYAVLLFAVAIIGVVSPFAFSSAADVGRVSPHLTVGGKSQHIPKPRSLVAQTAVAEAVSTESNGSSSRSRIRQFFSKLNPTSGRRDGTWRGGESTATIPSRLFFMYVSPLLDLSMNRTLTESDAFARAEKYNMDNSVDSLTAKFNSIRHAAQKRIEAEKEKGGDKAKRSQSILLLRALISQQWGMLFLTGFLRLLNTGVQAFPAILVSRLLKCIEAGNTLPISQAMSSAVALVAVLNIKMITENQFFLNVAHMSTKTRGSLEGMIFDKSLRLPDGGSGLMAKQRGSAKKKALGNGGVMNLMQSDASIIEAAASQIHTLWDGPLQLAMYTTLLYRYLGRSVLYGLAVLLTVIPINSVTLRILDRLSGYENEARDARTKRTAESIGNMQLLKLQGWEQHFANDIRKHRTEELTRHKNRGIVRAANSAISNSVPALVLVATFAAYHRTGKPILASTVFTAIALFNQLRFPLMFYPMLIDSLANGKNSLRRIASYLTSAEVTPYVQKLPPTKGGEIEMRNGNFLWSTSDAPKDGEVPAPEAPALCNVNLSVEPGEVVAVVGPVGSGKSALIKSLLGELAPVPRMVVDTRATDSGTDAGIDKPTVKVHGNVAYCSQDAWLPKGTIRDAILFGREYDEKRFKDAIYDAGLDRDMGHVDSVAGVLTEDTDVGEGGSSLSGGQRARVALARTLYSGEDTKVFLLDDCLAALDASVGSMVFERVTRRLKSIKAAALVVTNDPSIPRRCDRVVLMGPVLGRKPSTASCTCSTIIDIGTHGELRGRGHKLQGFSPSENDAEKPVVTISHESTQETPHQEVVVEGAPKSLEAVRVAGGYKVNATSTDNCHADPECTEIDLRNSPDIMSERVITNRIEREEDVVEVHMEEPEVPKETPAPVARGRSSFLSTDDNMSTGAIPLETYMGYLRAVGSPGLLVSMVLAFVITNIAQFYQQYLLAAWTELAGGNALAAALGGSYIRSLIYGAGVVSTCLWVRSYLLTLVGTRASEFYHDRMISSVFRAPMSFFDATPSGQILSRFGKEMGTIDRALPDSISAVLFCALQIGSSAMALAGAITPAMVVPMLFVGNLYLRAIRRFRPAARDMKRCESSSRSPIFTHFGEALRGTDVIRSIPGAISTWSKRHRALCDNNLSVFSTVKALDRWLSVTLEFLGNSMVLASAVASVYLSRTSKLSPGSAGWGLTQSLAITGLMAWAVRNLTTLEGNMMSVMRVRELMDLDSEAADVGEYLKKENAGTPRALSGPGKDILGPSQEDRNLNNPQTPPSDKTLKAAGWPWRGDVRFKNVSMRYNPYSPLVLNRVTIGVPPGTTLGVVGRTGSGKSSLLLTLFRIAEIEKGGSIEIDGVDIRSVSIQTLRESLSIIPQDPVLFAGTIRFNLDATGKASEEDMWNALEAASPELARQFRSGAGLDSPVSEGGHNLSQGQRQLICLARAMVRKSKILVMDEATSSVDMTTDMQVQATIRREFVDKGVSVITVAHRLDTVLGHDKIAVLGNGRVLEYGSPSELLKDRNGELRKLVDSDRSSKRKGKKPSEAIAV